MHSYVKHILCFTACLCFYGCNNKPSEPHNDKVKSGTPRRYYDYVKPTGPDTCLTDSIARMLSSDIAFDSISIDSFRSSKRDEKTIEGIYYGTHRFVPQGKVVLVHDVITNKDNPVICYYQIRGKVAIARDGKVKSHTKEKVVPMYVSACGLTENDFNWFVKGLDSVNMKAPKFMEVDHKVVQVLFKPNTVEYLCDTIFLFDKPFGSKMTAITDKSELLAADYFGDTWHNHNEYSFAHVTRKDGTKGWVNIYHEINLTLLGSQIPAPIHFHYRVSLVLKK